VNTGLRNIIFIIFPVVMITGLLIFADSYSKGSSYDKDVCLSCHEDETLTMEKNGKKLSLFVSKKQYDGSVHNVAECEDCHEGYVAEELPHSKSPKEVNCLSCHKSSEKIQSSVHAKVKCYDCHSKHDIKPGKQLAQEKDKNCLKCHNTKNVQHYSQSVHAKNNVGCEGCHGSGHQVKKISKQETEQVCGKCHGQHEKNFDNSIHKTVLNKGNSKAPTCTDCHGSHQIFQNKMSIESEACLKCHLDEKKFPGEEKGSARFVSRYKTSIHAAIEKEGLLEAAGCVDCHGDHNVQNPENPKASTFRARQMETCGKCHKEVVESFKKSKHGQELANKNDKAPTCSDCHSEHDIQSVLRSNQHSKISLTDKCLSCHKDSKIPHKNYKGEEEIIQDYQNSDHYIALKEGNQNAPTCYDCHGAHEMEKTDNPGSKIHKKNIAQTCGQTNCHTSQLNEYTGSIHETSIREGRTEDSPTCNNCHGNHVIATKRIDDKMKKSREVIQLCSNCHASVEIVERNDLPTKVSETFMESFHGLAVRGGSKEAANCESCHGYHNIRPSSDSLSTINKKNLPQTCGKCHEGATQTLFESKIHLTNLEEDSPWVFWITRFYIIIIVLIVGFMFTHNVFDMYKKLKNKKSHK
jgi:hypothetical protein